MKAVHCAMLGLTAAVVAAPLRAEAHEHVTAIYQLGNGGFNPQGGVTLWHGQIYGTAYYGGASKCFANLGCGTLFRLTRAKSGGWAPETIYNFHGGKDGGNPQVQLTLGPDGSVYGYTTYSIHGTVFQLTPPSRQGGAWHFHSIYTFDHSQPYTLQNVFAPLVLHGAHLYGIALGGVPLACGNHTLGCGAVFRLDPPDQLHPAWRRTILHAFAGGDSGGLPNSITDFDASGATYVASGEGFGAVVQLHAPANHSTHWDAQTIARFNDKPDGSFPYNLALGSGGVVYGNSYYHRDQVFALTQSNGSWTKTDLAEVISNGYNAQSLALGPNGSLIGVVFGDLDFYTGNAFQVTPPANTGLPWTYKILWRFRRGPAANPLNIVAAPSGEMFGVLGGYGAGTVFELRP